MIYCVVPRELAHKLHEPLRRHFRDAPDVEVVVESRGRERRGSVERRSGEGESPTAEQRKVRGVGGRRVGERRAALIAVDPPALPAKARRHADRLSFVERVEPTDQHEEDLDTARLVVRFQSGEREVFATLYQRYFDRAYGYLRVLLSRPEDAEDAAQQVFTKVFEALPGYERRASPFRSWLFTIVRNQALHELHKLQRVDLVSLEETDDWREPAAAPEESSPVLDWITDRELSMFVERMPLAQRQVLLLRYMTDLSYAEIAQLLDRTSPAVRRMHSRALAHLRGRLSAVGRAPSRSDQAGARLYGGQARVVRARRFALTYTGPVR